MIVNVKNVSKNCRTKVLLHSANIEMEKGEICALIGPNGSGKTSLIKCLLGLLTPDDGEITIFNKSYEAYSRSYILKRIGAVLEFPQKMLKMSVQDIYNEQFTYLDLSPTISVEDILKLVELDVTAVDTPSRFSLGMKQRLLLGLALSYNPQLLILDEPFNGLDVEGVILMKTILVNYALLGNTILITSHSLKELSDIASTVVFMKEGKTRSKVKIEDINKNYDGGLLEFYQESQKGDNNE